MSLSICETCIEGQQIRAVFPKDMKKQTNKLLDIAHSDVFERVMGPSDLEKHPSRRNDTPMVVGVDEYSNSHSFNRGEDIGEHEEQVRDNLVAIQIPRG
jgi:hypothetical protein